MAEKSETDSGGGSREQLAHRTTEAMVRQVAGPRGSQRTDWVMEWQAAQTTEEEAEPWD